MKYVTRFEGDLNINEIKAISKSISNASFEAAPDGSTTQILVVETTQKLTDQESHDLTQYLLGKEKDLTDFSKAATAEDKINILAKKQGLI